MGNAGYTLALVYYPHEQLTFHFEALLQTTQHLVSFRIKYQSSLILKRCCRQHSTQPQQQRSREWISHVIIPYKISVLTPETLPDNAAHGPAAAQQEWISQPARIGFHLPAPCSSALALCLVSAPIRRSAPVQPAPACTRRCATFCVRPRLSLSALGGVGYVLQIRGRDFFRPVAQLESFKSQIALFIQPDMSN
jgi:hypothetical protein